MQMQNQPGMELLRKQTISSLIFIAGFSTALFLVMLVGIFDDGQRSIHDVSHSDKFPLISPLLFCEEGGGLENATNPHFRFELERYVNHIMRGGNARLISVYYRDLNNGPWFGINEEESFYPASLLKLPLFISVMKEKEDVDPAFLGKTVVYDGSDVVPGVQKVETQNKIIPGEKYTVAELVEHSIKYSDNEASILLYQILGDSKIKSVYQDLGMIAPEENKDIEMNVKDYGTFFRVLFNSSYLNRENSEAALELLTTTAFDTGLRAGVPESIPIAHKFGERAVNDNFLQLHDCGIVYAPKKPYLLCVMTQGAGLDELQNVIKDISKIVYDGVIENF